MGFFDLFKKKTNSHSSKVEPIPQIEVTTVLTEGNQLSEDGIPTLESLISTAYPSEHGLYPHEILMLEYASTYKTNGINNFQSFWKWDYSVFSPQELLNSLFQRGFLCLADISVSLQNMKVPELKQMLANKNAKVSGKKDELIARILSTYTENELSSVIADRYYALTDLGKYETAHNEYVLYLNRHRYFTPWQMNEILHGDNPQHLSYRDIIWREFNKSSEEYIKSRSFGLYRNTRFSMCEFLMDENRYKSALLLLCEVASYDLSGHSNGGVEDSDSEFMRKVAYDSKMTNLYTEDEKEISLYPGIAKTFQTIYAKLNMSADEFTRLVYDYCNEFQIHERIFTANECANVILSTLSLEDRKIEHSVRIASQRVKNLVYKS